MNFRISPVLPISLVCWAMCSWQVSAFQTLREISLAEKYRQSDIVAVGVVQSKEGSVGVYRLAIQYHLKGSSEKEIYLDIYAGLREWSVSSCCSIGGRYLVFLKRIEKNGRYMSVNGRFAVLELDSQ